ncbi:hypothetical protein QCE63_27995 [Caballeronia sp. LZ065]|uniref:hypothetical protein n=1 Tax=Caballeronia sp. LZ065 TaxID=3038571 RepID=UPI002859F914|nr:hypothetical protein [Caballeronia sp. LZ065]MDR5783256.1 hypothetical protein [Caballeronia sp. LZ065]
MHHSIKPYELTHIDLSRFQLVQISDRTFTVVLWEAPELTQAQMRPATLTIRLCDPLKPVRRTDVCEPPRTHLAAARFKQNRPQRMQQQHAVA